jgi:2-keto-4-pentenoate hydratase/2-oxohepta-3-ene-1,7-dioic acid hydratase in catechol pathway
MKLFRFGPSGQEKPGVLHDEKKLDVSAFGEDYGEAFLGSDGIARLGKWLESNASKCPVVSDSQRIGPPITRPSKIICVGLNYNKHALESAMEMPKEPLFFFKSSTAICGPFDDVIIPKNSVKTDWEVELAFVIGKKAQYVDEKDSMNHVAGYVLHNDISEREFQLERGGQWVKGKSADTFAPIGPYLVSTDEIADSNKLDIWLKLNGKMMQDSNTVDLIFEVPRLVSYISQFMTLLPGDLISTGTPAGVALGMKTPIYLKPGDVMELGIDGLGVSKQVVKAYQPKA